MVLLKALGGSSDASGDDARDMATDKEIYTRVLRGAHAQGNTFIPDRVEMALRQASALSLYTSRQCRAYLGAQFRAVLPDVPASASDEEAGTRLIQRHVFVHLPHKATEAKFELLIEMLRKLYSFCSGETAADNSDALQNHELLLGGHLYGMILKERLEQMLIGVRVAMEKDLETGYTGAKERVLGDSDYLKKIVSRQGDIGRKLFYFLATGNLVSESGLDLMQVSGYTIVAEKLNRYRYLSHFRSVRELFTFCSTFF
jgi:DNA-directed RNA polymerase I subunit RPA2